MCSGTHNLASLTNRVILSQLQRKDCITEIMPVNDTLVGLTQANKPHNHKSWDARRVLLHSQLNLVHVNKGY
jgi:hypothetical protein